MKPHPESKVIGMVRQSGIHELLAVIRKDAELDYQAAGVVAEATSTLEASNAVKRAICAADQDEWRRSLGGDPYPDEIDGEDFMFDPYVPNPPSRRKDYELSRVLAILDELEAGGENS